MWVLYFVIGFSTILTFNSNYQNMQYLCVGYKSWSNLQYSHLGLPFINIKGQIWLKWLLVNLVQYFHILYIIYWHTLTLYKW